MLLQCSWSSPPHLLLLWAPTTQVTEFENLVLIISNSYRPVFWNIPDCLKIIELLNVYSFVCVNVCSLLCFSYSLATPAQWDDETGNVAFILSYQLISTLRKTSCARVLRGCLVKASHLFAAADNFSLAAIPNLAITFFLRKSALEIVILCDATLPKDHFNL